MQLGSRKSCMKKMRRRPDFYETKCAAGKTYEMRRRPDFLTNSQWVLCPTDIVCNLYFTNHSSESSSFN
jgi:hypothetical protein